MLDDINVINKEQQLKLTEELTQLESEHYHYSYFDNYDNKSYIEKEAAIIRRLISNRRDFSIKYLANSSKYCGVADGLAEEGHVIHCEGTPVTIELLLIEVGHISLDGSKHNKQTYRQDYLSNAQDFHNEMIARSKRDACI